MGHNYACIRRSRYIFRDQYCLDYRRVTELHEGLVPDVSLGTHFFNDLVEYEMQYLAIYPGRKENSIDKHLIGNYKNQLISLIEDGKRWESVIAVIDPPRMNDESSLVLSANTYTQRAFCYFRQDPNLNS